MKWQKFLVFEMELKIMAQKTVETSEEDTSADEFDPEVDEETSPVDAVADSTVTTSSEVEVAPTKVTTNSATDIGIPAKVLRVEMVEENHFGESTTLQVSSNQPDAAGPVEELGGGIFDQIRSYFDKNAEIVKLNNEQTEFTMSRLKLTLSIKWLKMTKELMQN